MKWLLGIFFVTFPFVLWSQENVTSGLFYSKPYWITLGLTYNHVEYEEPRVMTEKGGNGGVQLELGANLLSGLSVSFWAEHLDGRLFYEGSTFSGTAIETITNDYFGDYRLKFYGLFESFIFSVGYGLRNWYDDLVVSYRRRTEYRFIPIQLIFLSSPYYFSFEFDSWLQGKNTSYMSDVNTSRKDVEMAQNVGSGYGFEVGWITGGSPQTKSFLRIHKWGVDQSEVANDGVDNLVEPKNNTLSMVVGIGLIF